MRHSSIFGALVAAGLAATGTAQAGLNDPFGPELACYAAIAKPADSLQLQKIRKGKFPTVKSLAVPVLDTEGPSLSIETISSDKMSTHLRIFTESGEFEADFPLPVSVIPACLEGVGFPTGPGSSLYTNVDAKGSTRFGNLTNYRHHCGPSPGQPGPFMVHQVGQAGQAASRARLHGELANMIGNVHSSWQERVKYAALEGPGQYRLAPYGKPHLDFTAANHDPESGTLSDEAQKRGLRKCLEVLQGDSFRDLRAAAERELGLFDTKPVGGGKPPATTAIPPN